MKPSSSSLPTADIKNSFNRSCSSLIFLISVYTVRMDSSGKVPVASCVCVAIFFVAGLRICFRLNGDSPRGNPLPVASTSLIKRVVASWIVLRHLLILSRFCLVTLLFWYNCSLIISVLRLIKFQNLSVGVIALEISNDSSLSRSVGISQELGRSCSCVSSRFWFGPVELIFNCFACRCFFGSCDVAGCNDGGEDCDAEAADCDGVKDSVCVCDAAGRIRSCGDISFPDRVC